MRVIYLVRSAQLLLTLRALFLLYSVGSFCEQNRHKMQDCSNMIARIPLVTPEQIDEHLRIRQQRPAGNRPDKTTSGVSSATATTAQAPSISQSSTVSTTGEVKKRVKRDDVARELPGNGMSEAQRKAAAAVETKKEEKKKEKKEEEGKKPAEVKIEAKADEKKEVKKEETVTTQAPVHHEEKKVQQKSENTEAKDGKVEVKTEEKKKVVQKPASEVKTEVKADEKKKSEHPSGEKKEAKTVVKKVKPVQTTTEASKEPKKEKKEHLGAEIHIPVAPDAHHHDEKTAEGKNSAHFSSPSGDKHHTVKKDLKVHVQEPVKIEDTKKELPPKLSAVHEKFVLEHSDAFLQEVRCLEVTSDDYFGKELSPYGQHLKGLMFAGPVLVVIGIYLMCTVLRARLCNETPAQFTDTLGCAFHAGMWLVVALSMLFICSHWDGNWRTISNDTFVPAFPIQWSALMLLSLIMMVAVAVEGWFNRRLYDDVVIERSYRCYEVIDTTESTPNEGHFSRLSSPRIF